MRYPTKNTIRPTTRGARHLWNRLLHLVCRAEASRRDAGMVTSEYAMGIVAAVAFAAVLYKVVTSGQVNAELQGLVKKALDGGP